MTIDKALADVYGAASRIRTDALTSKGLPPEQISAYLQEGNRRLQDALVQFEFARGAE